MGPELDVITVATKQYISRSIRELMDSIFQSEDDFLEWAIQVRAENDMLEGINGS